MCSTANRTGATRAPPFVVARDITKSFGGAQALKGVSLDIVPGEVHGLVGANGAGKSTLIKILAGLVHPDGGTMEIDGRPVSIETPHRATELGMNFIHQELAFMPGMTVLQNIMLGIPKRTRFGLVDWRAIATRGRADRQRASASPRRSAPASRGCRRPRTGSSTSAARWFARRA